MGVIYLAADDAAKIEYGFLIDFNHRPNVFFVCYLFRDSFPDHLIIFSCHCSCHHNIDVFISPVHFFSLPKKDSEYCAKRVIDYNRLKI